MRIIGVIPARYQSSRFPGKPLALIKGRMLIERVWEQASKSRLLDKVLIATDDLRIAEAVRGFGGNVVMTSRSCASGTDRLAEVARKTEKKADILINIQGDEPLISPLLIDRMALALKQDRALPVVTAAYPITDASQTANPNAVKVVMDSAAHALYFSRCAIPFERDGKKRTHYKHMGIYGYRKEFLLKFASWEQTPLETAEQLEQLRILEKGFKIKVIVSRTDSCGVDVPADIKKIESILRKVKS